MLELQSTFKFTPTTGWSTVSARATRWFVPPLTTLPLASRRCRVNSAINRAVAELSLDEHAVLAACEGCRTLADHAALVERKLNIRQEERNTIARWLESFAAVGLFVSIEELVRRFGSAPSAPAVPCSGVIIRTCDRPNLLARTLASISALQARYDASHRYLILDDSRNAANRAENRRLISGQEKLDCAYYDLSEPSALDCELRVAFPACGEEIDWLLGPPTSNEATYGRPVNLALLLTAGSRFLLLDDDALLEPRSPPVSGAGFAVSSDADELFCYVSQAALLDACPPLDIDPLGAHLEYLGDTVARSWGRVAAGSLEPAVTNFGAEDALRFTDGARILFTQNHALGDPGSALFPYHLLSLPTRSRQFIFDTPASSRYAFRDRFNWRGQTRLRLATTRPLTFTTLTGADNSVILPPTVRSHRNEDLLLGQLAQHAHPGGWMVDLPWALPHRRDPPKQWLDASAMSPQEPVHFLLDYLERHAAVVASDQPERRLETLGALLIDLSLTSDRRLTDMLEAQAADVATRSVFSISMQLDDATTPAHWKDAIRPWLDSPALSTDPARLLVRLASPALVRNLALNYGRALEAWPGMWAWARGWRKLGKAAPH